MKKVLNFLKRSIVFENSVLVYLLGLCPILAATTSLVSGLGIGIAALIVLVLSGVVISLIGRFIPESIKAVSYMVIVSFFVAVSELLLKAFLPSLSEALGIYLPLLSVSGIAFARVERADKETVGAAALGGLSMGIGYLAVSLVLSFLRELLGNGTFFGIRVFPEEYGAISVSSPAGALILLGFLLAAFCKLVSYMKEKEGEQ